MNSVHFKSETAEWATPQTFFDGLNMEFKFTLDVCATPDNAKCRQYFTIEDDGLSQQWGEGEVCWMNPPYGREIAKWMEKAFRSAQQGALVVCLVPARTDTEWWHKWALRASDVRYIRGRLKFGGCENSAPFPSAVVIFRPAKIGVCHE